MQCNTLAECEACIHLMPANMLIIDTDVVVVVGRWKYRSVGSGWHTAGAATVTDDVQLRFTTTTIQGLHPLWWSLQNSQRLAAYILKIRNLELRRLFDRCFTFRNYSYNENKIEFTKIRRLFDRSSINYY